MMKETQDYAATVQGAILMACDIIENSNGLVADHLFKGDYQELAFESGKRTAARLVLSLLAGIPASYVMDDETAISKSREIAKA